MMNLLIDCSLDTKKLERFLAGTLPQQAKTLVATHIEQCTACQQRLERLTNPAPASHLTESQQRVWSKLFDGSLSDDNFNLPPSAAERLDANGEAASVSGTDHWPLPEIPGYAILEETAVEPWGTTYLASQLKYGRDVTLRVFQGVGSTAIPRLQHELHVRCKVQHRHCVETYETGEVAGVPWLVTESLNGESLAQHRETSEGARLSTAAACHYLQQSLLALQAMHDAGLTHGQIDSTKVFLSVDGTLKLLPPDFQRLQPDPTPPPISDSSLDLLAIALPRDQQTTDLCDLGRTFYTLLEETSVQSTRLNALLDAMMSPDSTMPPRSAGEFVAALADLSQPEPDQTVTHKHSLAQVIIIGVIFLSLLGFLITR